jgi:hypothetical protein
MCAWKNQRKMKLKNIILWRHRQCERCKGRENCYVRITTIHKSAVECTSSHRSVDNGKSIGKVDGDGVV